MITNIEWTGDSLKIIDQTELPGQLKMIELQDANQVHEAIQKLRIRGAPALGVAAAFGLFLGLKNKKLTTKEAFLNEAKKIASYLSGARPTAVNVDWALHEILKRLAESEGKPLSLLQQVLNQAKSLKNDDKQRCQEISQYGSALVNKGMTILTHCNTGALATAGIGTALGIISTAAKQGKMITVLVDETRPLLQGARLTMWELDQLKIPARLILWYWLVQIELLPMGMWQIRSGLIILLFLHIITRYLFMLLHPCLHLIILFLLAIRHPLRNVILRRSPEYGID
jgi:methylthioribose-1-phosphate isomerase